MTPSLSKVLTDLSELNLSMYLYFFPRWTGAEYAVVVGVGGDHRVRNRAGFVGELGAAVAGCLPSKLCRELVREQGDTPCARFSPRV